MSTVKSRDITITVVRQKAVSTLWTSVDDEGELNLEESLGPPVETSEMVWDMLLNTSYQLVIYDHSNLSN